MAQVEITQIQEKEIRIFETVLMHAAEVIAFNRFYVALYDRRNASLYFPLVQLEDGARRTLPEINKGPWVAHPYNPEKQWPDCLLHPDAPLPNGSDFPTWLATHEINYQPDPQPRSWLIAPLKARGAVMGVLVAEDLHRDRAYDRELQTWFSAMANRVSGTLSSLRLVESLRTVNRVGQRLTAEARQDIPQVLDLIHEQASQLLDARDMYIALYDPGLQELRFPLAYQDGVREDEDDWPARQLLDVGVTEEVIRNRQPLRLDNYRQWYADKDVEPPVKPEESPKSWIGVPLLSGDRVLGVIALQNDEVEGLYSEDDQDILQTMANQAAAAIANVRLVERLRAVNEVGQQLTSGVRLEEDEILNLIYEQAGRLMDTRDMFIAFYDAEKQELSFPLFYVDGELIEWESRPVDLEDVSQRKLTEEVLYTGEALNVSNFSQWFEERGRPVPEKPPKSWLGVPLMIEDRVLGVIALQNDEIESLYGPDDVEVLQAMASQAAFAVLTLENARLLKQESQLREQEKQLREKEQQKSKQLAALQDIGVKLTSQLELTEVLSAIAQYANEIISADFSTLFPYDSQQDQFGHGIRKGKIDVEPSIPSNTGYTAQLAKRQKSVFVQNAELESGAKAAFSTAKGVKSYAGVPLVIKERTVGVLYVNFLEFHTFSEEEEEAVQLLANQAAVAIENARLYAALEREKRELRSRLINAERLLVESRFAINYIHRINNLVGTIPIRVSQIKEKLTNKEEILQLLNPFLTGIINDAQNVSPIIEELDGLSTREQQEPQLEKVDVVESLKRVARRVGIESPVRIDLHEKYPTDSRVEVMSIRWELSDAFWNILKNAVDAMKGRVVGEIEINVCKIDTGIVPLVEIDINNNGPKIPQENLDNLFEPFITTKTSGTGYGLWRTKHVIEDSLGGSIKISNAQNDSPDGVNVKIRLPLPTD